MPPTHGHPIANIPEKPPPGQVAPEVGFEPLVQAMIRVFQMIVGGNLAPANRGLPLERLHALGGKDFHGT